MATTGTNTETAKFKPSSGPSCKMGNVVCAGGTATIRTAFSKILNVQLTIQAGIDPTTAPATFDTYTEGGAQTVHVYANNQEQENDTVDYIIWGLL